MRHKLTMVAATLLALLVTPLAANAQTPAPAGQNNAPPPGLKIIGKLTVEKDKVLADPAAARAQAITIAAGLMAASGAPCAITDAIYRGSAPLAGSKPVKNVVAAEVACQEGFGYVVMKAGDEKPTIYDCVAATFPAEGKPQEDQVCRLPANTNPAQSMQAYLAPTGSNCNPTAVAYQGEAATMYQYEAKCADGSGLVVQINKPRSLQAKLIPAPCMAYIQAGKPYPCHLTTEQANLDSVLALGGKSNPPCAATKARYMVGETDNSSYYELACSSGVGVVMHIKASGQIVLALPCAKAQALAGGCKLTDPAAGVAQVVAEYTNTLKAAGYPCDVAKFQVRTPKANQQEVVELTCKTGLGAVAITQDGKTTAYNCGRSQAEGFSCSLNGPDAAFAAITAQLRAAGKASCTVNGLRPAANSTNAFLEVTCSDGAPGYMIRYPKGSNEPAQFMNCGEAAALGGCQLAGNKKS